MPYGKKVVYQDVMYLRKNHFCPTCEGKVDIVDVSRIVDSNSAEAENFDFSLSRKTQMVGEIEFHWKEFECKECAKRYTIDEMKKIEGVQEKPKYPTSPKEVMIHNLKVIAFVVLAALISAIIQHFLSK